VKRRLGAIVQGLLLGALLAIALLNLVALSASAHLFRYQGF
jgi:hypothetical protein